ncbi:MAG: glycosyltransferase family 39 protein [Chloroflexi bacterium]|nr:glycosyltransferase family 39 protein [Chloroflexota bacterium]
MAQRTTDRRHPALTRLGGRSIAAALALAAIAALPILLYLPFMDEPVNVDEGIYGAVARGLLEGNIPYRDLFDNKPPLHYVWYALSFTLFGDNPVAPRILASLALSGTALLVFAQARLVLSKPAAYLAATAFAVATASPWLNQNATSESYMLLPMTGSLVALTLGLRSGRGRWFLVAGVLTGVAVLSKPLALWSMVALGVFAVVWGHTQGRGLRPALLLASGAAAVGVLVVVPFVLTGTFDELFEANVRFNLALGEDLRWKKRLLLIVFRGLIFFPLVAAPLLLFASAGAIALWRSRPWRSAHLLFPWLGASAVGLPMSGFLFPHHFMTVLPAMALLAGAAFEVLPLRPPLTRQRRFVMWAGGAAAAMITVLSVAANLPAYLAPTADEQHVERMMVEQQALREIASRDIGHYIAEQTQPGDTIYVHGWESGIYSYAGRLPAARYFYDLVIYVRRDQNPLAEVVGDLREHRPAFIVDSTAELKDTEWEMWEKPDAWKGVDMHPPEWQALLAERYEYVGRMAFAEIYRLKGHDPVRDGALGAAFDGGTGTIRGER